MDLNVQNGIGFMLAVGSVVLGVVLSLIVVGPEKRDEVYKLWKK